MRTSLLWLVVSCALALVGTGCLQRISGAGAEVTEAEEDGGHADAGAHPVVDGGADAGSHEIADGGPDAGVPESGGEDGGATNASCWDTGVTCSTIDCCLDCCSRRCTGKIVFTCE